MSDLIALLRSATAARIDPGHTAVVVSGGIDSSTVASLVPHLPMFTGYYDYPGCDEREYANLAAGEDWTQVLITPQGFIDNFLAMLPHLQPPFQGMGTFGQYMVGKAIAQRSEIRVVLSGEGADELFGGYARLMAVAGHPLPDGYDNYVVPAEYPDTLAEALQFDYDRLGDLLAVDDQCMAAHGLDARAPFTDPAVVDYALSLPDLERVAKRHLREAVRGIVPDEIIDRTDKKGFPAPLVAWANGPCREFVGDLLGYIPDLSQPWNRGWWVELCEKHWPGETVEKAA